MTKDTNDGLPSYISGEEPSLREQLLDGFIVYGDGDEDNTLDWGTVLPILTGPRRADIDGPSLGALIHAAACHHHPDNWHHINGEVLSHKNMKWCSDRPLLYGVANALFTDQPDLAEGLYNHLSPPSVEGDPGTTMTSTDGGEHWVPMPIDRKVLKQQSWRHARILAAAGESGTEEFGLRVLAEHGSRIFSEHLESILGTDPNYAFNPEGAPVLYGEIQNTLAQRDLDHACTQLVKHGHSDFAETIQRLREQQLPKPGP